ncbi:acyl dehydratase [Allocatelliglobosispora scoriae]|uniref:Acyl dehydratase n=1 Tax=Allocatelliglobosispora scoriae TaxID=643052 RepID=A0A841C336_9ACTN|nr:MaoC/PaaZ C-terminal domain-containing protein [Allocatelliglobosispora scoriae]MBB5873370.1 acyl dehydratase [Allocatelliglobosispora scoriae]
MIAVGLELPVRERTIELPDMIAYAGATWDWHRLHYDHEYLADRGLSRPVVDGQLFGALLAEQVLDWAGPGARLTALSFRFAGLVFAGETVRLTGTVTAVDGDTVTLDLRVEVTPDGRPAVAPAAATILLPPAATTTHAPAPAPA